MSEVPANLQYARTHEWVRREDDGRVVIGITDYAQQSLGDITFVQLPPPGARINAGAMFGVIESVKAAADIYSPVPGLVEAVNRQLINHPPVINSAPYGDGWLVRFTQSEATLSLISAEEYRSLVAEAPPPRTTTG